MFHPFFKAVLQRPDLLVQHLSNHIDLIKAEAATTGRSLAMKGVAALLAGLLLLLALGLTGVAVMLGFVHAFHAALVAVPGVAWAFALLSLVPAMRRSPAAQAQREVMSEIEADLAVLREVREEQDERERPSTASAGRIGAFASSAGGTGPLAGQDGDALGADGGARASSPAKTAASARGAAASSWS